MQFWFHLVSQAPHVGHLYSERDRFTHDYGIFWATVVLAIVTAAMSVATFLVARKTADLSRETLDASLLADIHHQESQSAVVVWNSDSGMRFIDVDDQGIHIRGYVANVGFGPATNIRIQLNNPKTAVGTGVFLPSLAAGQEYPERSPAEGGRLTRDDNLWKFTMMPGTIRDRLLDGFPNFSIEYNTVFDRPRSTRYVGGGTMVAGVIVQMQYTQEVIDLNRDDRIGKLIKAFPTTSVGRRRG